MPGGEFVADGRRRHRCWNVAGSADIPHSSNRIIRAQHRAEPRPWHKQLACECICLGFLTCPYANICAIRAGQLREAAICLLASAHPNMPPEHDVPECVCECRTATQRTAGVIGVDVHVGAVAVIAVHHQRTVARGKTGFMDLRIRMEPVGLHGALDSCVWQRSE